MSSTLHKMAVGDYKTEDSIASAHSTRPYGPQMNNSELVQMVEEMLGPEAAAFFIPNTMTEKESQAMMDFSLSWIARHPMDGFQSIRPVADGFRPYNIEKRRDMSQLMLQPVKALCHSRLSQKAKVFRAFLDFCSHITNPSLMKRSHNRRQEGVRRTRPYGVKRPYGLQI